MILMLSAHVLGSLWFAVGDTEGGWVIEERLHEAVLSASARLKSGHNRSHPDAVSPTVDDEIPGALVSCWMHTNDQ